MKRIFNIPRKECKEIYPKIAANGDDLIIISQLSASKGKYGIALSLIILGAEEYAKAIVTMLHSFNVKVFKINEFREVFSSHKRKHEVATLIELFNLVEPLMELGNWNIRRKIRKEEFRWTDRFLLNMNDLVKVIHPIIEIGDNIKWWDKADKMKISGFYVDYSDTLMNPKDLSKNDYLIAQPAVDKLRRNYRLLNIAFNRLQKKDIEDLINVLNEGIDLFIENEKNVMLNNGDGRMQ